VFVACAGSKSCTIKKLNLSNNAIGYQGAAYIAEALASAETLEELNLSGAILRALFALAFISSLLIFAGNALGNAGVLVSAT
jgi:hypothetical protein